MSNPRDSKVYVDPETNKFVVEEDGDKREATPEEADQQIEKWEEIQKEAEKDLS